MRITTKQQQSIKTNVSKIFGLNASVLLFGSRVKDEGLGGDFDLLIGLPKPVETPLKKSLKLNALLQLAMGGLQKIDIITHIKGSVETVLYKEAIKTGIKL